jgi:MFS family permease
VLLYGVVAFTAASLLCGVSTDIYMLIVFRAIQAIGGGALIPAAAGLVSDHFGKDRDRAIGMFGTMAASGQVVGPVFGGLLVGYLSWRWIFFVNVPIGIVLVTLTICFIPESRLQGTDKLDVRGLLLMSFGVLAAIFGVTSLGNGHTEVYDPIVLIPVLSAIGLLYLFVRHANRAPAPFIPMRLLRGRAFAVVNSVNFLFGVVTFGVASLLPLYAEQRYHLHALGSGTLLDARAIGVISVGTIAAFSLRRTGYRWPILIGFSIVALGTLLLSVSPRLGLSPYVWLSIGAGITGLGSGAANPASRNASMQLAPNDVAAITGLRQMFVQLGVVFSVSIVTAILNRSPDPGITMAHILWVVSAIAVVLMLPLVYRIPEHKGTW